MKMQFSKNRIRNTFIIYFIVILIPIVVLIFQGITSLKNLRGQIEGNVRNKVQRVGERFERNLSWEWQNFLDQEKLRKFYHYHPLIIPELDNFFDAQGSAVQRSPLFTTVENLANLYELDGDTFQRKTVSPFSPSPKDVLHNSRVGYFQFDPHENKISSPYLDRSQRFSDSVPRAEIIETYQRFLEERVLPHLVDTMNLDKRPVTRPADLMQRIRATRVNREDERVERFQNFKKMYPELAQVKVEGTTVRVDYYDFMHTKINTGEGQAGYLLSYRSVILGNSKLVIQGFFFNLAAFIQDAQASLEPYQPEYGQVVVSMSTDPDATPLNYPFNEITLMGRMGDQERYLADYRNEKNRFWTAMIVLISLTAGSLLHLGILIHGNIMLDRKKNNFISAITHELKAPLTSIIMYAEMLEEGWVKGKESIYYRHIHGESERLSRLIKNILDFSGIERGTFKLKKTSFPLHTFIQETLEPLQLWIRNNDVEVDLKIRATPNVIADKDSLSQVLYNLCDNAIKYGQNPNGQTILTIQIDETPAHSLLSVHDNGLGVAKKEENKVFNKFYRCENEMTREKTGTGLGLALVKELVEENGGLIEAYRPQGHSGFGIRIFLPKVVIEPSLQKPSPDPIDLT